MGEILIFFPLLGVVTGFTSIAYVRAYFGFDALAARIRGGRFEALMPWVAGAVVGAMVLLSHGLLVGYGHLALHAEMFGQLAWYTLFGLAAGGIVATAITLAGGGSGGAPGF